jgi:hypothetical protein
VNTEERSRTVVARVYPASDPATVARSYVLLYFTIWQQVLGYNDDVGCFAMRLAVRLVFVVASRAALRRAYKGAWRGLHVGTGADITRNPRLSPTRVLQGHPPWAASGSAMG